MIQFLNNFSSIKKFLKSSSLFPFRFSLFTRASRGFSVIETLIYVAILGAVVSTAIYFLANTFKTYSKIYAQKEVAVNIQYALDMLTEEIRFSKNIYSPTSAFDQDNGQISVETSQNPPTEEIRFSKNIYSPTSAFDQDNGQISVETSQNPPTGETTAFIDFYLDNGRIYMKKEGQDTLPLTSNQVKINKLKFTLLNPANAPEGTQIFIEGQYNSSGALQYQSLMDFTTSAIVRYR